MPLPKALQGDKWTERIVRTVFPLIIWYAKNGRTITYGDLNKEVVNRGWHHSVPDMGYGKPAGAIGNALIETEEKWEDIIPPLNALIINKATRLPGSGANRYLEKYTKLKHVDMSDDEKKLSLKRYRYFFV